MAWKCIGDCPTAAGCSSWIIRSAPTRAGRWSGRRRQNELRRYLSGDVVKSLLNRTSWISALIVALSTAAFAAGTPASSAARSRAELNAQLGRRYFEEVWNRGNVEVLDQLLSPDYINHTPSTPN